MKKTKNRKFPGVFLPGRMMRTMKLMTLLLVLQTFQVTAKGYSQENITLKMKNVTFAEVVKEIERQSKVTFLYNHDYVRELDRLNPDYSNLNLQEVLDHILTGTNLEYKLIDNTVVITAKQGQDQFEQEIQTIKGKVVDVQGHTLPDCRYQGYEPGGCYGYGWKIFYSGTPWQGCRPGVYLCWNA